MRHSQGLATRTQISVCKSPFPSAGTAVSLLHAKTVQQRPLTVMKIINTIISYKTNGIDTVGLNIQLDTL